LLRDRALAAAARVDESLARGTATGALHGVPINVKESFAVAGQPCTWGIPASKESRAPAHAVAVRRLLDARAILLGGTNVPFQLKDHQTFNDVYGRTNNPWDLAWGRGGSKGGGSLPGAWDHRAVDPYTSAFGEDGPTQSLTSYGRQALSHTGSLPSPPCPRLSPEWCVRSLPA
jgi:hypothetical protein